MGTFGLYAVLVRLGVECMKNKTVFSLDTNKKSRKDRRSKLEIYYDILNAITKESSYGEVKPTRVQFMSNTSYDKLITYFDELEKKQ